MNQRMNRPRAVEAIKSPGTRVAEKSTGRKAVVVRAYASHKVRVVFDDDIGRIDRPISVAKLRLASWAD